MPILVLSLCTPRIFPGTTGTSMKVVQDWFRALLWAAAWVLILCNNTQAAVDNCDLGRRYERVRFDLTQETTAADYTGFIKDIVNNLDSGSRSNEIPLLREPSRFPTSHPRRFMMVEMRNSEQETVTLAMDAVNANVVAYRSGSQSYFFRDAPEGATSHLFTGTDQHTLSYGGSYEDLEEKAEADRGQIELGREALVRAVSSLRHASSSRRKARSLIVVTQMMCEAARFRDILWRVRRSFRNGESFVPNTYMLSLENTWDHQSTRVQQSIGGVFKTPLTLQVGKGGHRTTLSNVRDVAASLALMRFVCRDRSSVLSSRDDDLPLLIKSVVGSDDTCPVWEPTVRISGRNGLCVDVRDGQYHNGNAIQLSQCKSNDDPNQLWNLRRDGTIRSNGRCLTTYGYAPGGYVMIFDCNTAAHAAARWEIWPNGTIINPISALVLGAASGNSGGTLTVQTNVYASRQGWVASNHTKPREVTIVGFRDLCMQEFGPAVWLETCVANKQEQIWALYADGSIRPKQNRNRCLTSLSDSHTTPVTIESCVSGSSGQRWMFTNDGTILNLNNGKVMDVKQSDPSLRQIIIYPVTGNPNQEWLPLPVPA